MSTTKKILVYHIGRLQDKSAEVRLKAISELTLLGDPDALDALQEVFKNDPDASVRKAAQDAGRALYARKQASQS